MYKNTFVLGLNDKRNHFKFFLAIYYDYLVKAKGRSIYNSVIFDPSTPPKNSKGMTFDKNALLFSFFKQVNMTSGTLLHVLCHCILIACSNEGADKYIMV